MAESLPRAVPAADGRTMGVTRDRVRVMQKDALDQIHSLVVDQLSFEERQEFALLIEIDTRSSRE